MASILAKFDVFRRLDSEFQSGTYHGAVVTVTTWLLMSYLLWKELGAMMYGEYTTEVGITDDIDVPVTINFNVTMLDLPCKFAVINIWDIFEDYKINVTEGVTERTNMHYENGLLVEGDVHEEREIVTEDMGEVELDKLGHHAVQLEKTDDKDIDTVLQEHFDMYDNLFINFMANWCIWSKRLAPVWESTALKVDEARWLHKGTRSKLVSVDCSVYADVCRKHRIMGFPTIYAFKKGEKGERYEDDRTVDKIFDWVSKTVRGGNNEIPNTWKNAACRLAGSVSVPRVPGNLIFQAQSTGHSLSPSMTNVSHHIDHLSFGRDIDVSVLGLPPAAAKSYSPLDGRRFLVKELHHAPHHYLKVVKNRYSYRGFFGSFGSTYEAYQMTTQNRVKTYHIMGIPEAQFTYTFASVSLDHANRGQGAYHSITNFCAILGGTYAVMELTNTIMNQFLIYKGHAPRLPTRH